jgi:hypothetical protein
MICLEKALSSLDNIVYTVTTAIKNARHAPQE